MEGRPDLLYWNQNLINLSDVRLWRELKGCDVREQSQGIGCFDEWLWHMTLSFTDKGRLTLITTHLCATSRFHVERYTHTQNQFHTKYLLNKMLDVNSGVLKTWQTWNASLCLNVSVTLVTQGRKRHMAVSVLMVINRPLLVHPKVERSSEERKGYIFADTSGAAGTRGDGVKEAPALAPPNKGISVELTCLISEESCGFMAEVADLSSLWGGAGLRGWGFCLIRNLMQMEEIFHLFFFDVSQKPGLDLFKVGKTTFQERNCFELRGGCMRHLKSSSVVTGAIFPMFTNKSSSSFKLYF